MAPFRSRLAARRARAAQAAARPLPRREAARRANSELAAANREERALRRESPPEADTEAGFRAFSAALAAAGFP